jgi:hypothetical protein
MSSKSVFSGSRDPTSDSKRPLQRRLALYAGAIGVPVATWYFVSPILAAILAVIEPATYLAVYAVALFGSDRLSDRAFRLLNWFSGLPDPKPSDRKYEEPRRIDP